MNDQSTKNKDAVSSNGMAATSHPLATDEAIRILKKGGNAIDAAIAASVVLSVVEPNATSIGGDCFAIIKMEGKNTVAYNGSGIAPEKASFEYFKKKKIGHISIVSSVAGYRGLPIAGAYCASKSALSPIDLSLLPLFPLTHATIPVFEYPSLY